MRAFEIRFNGKRLCTGGIGEDGVLSAIVSSVVGNRGDDLFLQFGGLISRTEEHVDWIYKRLRRGDKVQIKILDAKTADKPVRKRKIHPGKPLIDEKRYVRILAKKLGWTIQGRQRAN